MEINLSRFQRRESSLTVIRGSVATVLSNWGRLDDSAKQALLTAALARVEDLVLLLEEEAGPLRLADVESK